MKKVILILILVSSLTTFSQESDKYGRIMTYGFRNPTYDMVFNKVAENWNIEIYPAAGCIISQKLLDSIKTEHKKLWKAMDSIHENNSYQKFTLEVNSEFNRVNESLEILNSNKSVKKRIRKIKQRRKFISETIVNFTDKNIYIWEFSSLEKNWNENSNWKIEFYVKVNLEQNIVEIFEIKPTANNVYN